ncbi:hypothetical protein BKA82DRAFT_4131602 [Pisolithus tinctorius]|nr:hypothetical protein BKA82DRAFT_4131602 [Pisolithus tinctorius]
MMGLLALQEEGCAVSYTLTDCFLLLYYLFMTAVLLGLPELLVMISLLYGACSLELCLMAHSYP